jgi:hypothetical protein
MNENVTPPEYTLFRRRVFGNWYCRFEFNGRTVKRSCYSKHQLSAQQAAVCWIKYYQSKTSQLRTLNNKEK